MQQAASSLFDSFVERAPGAGDRALAAAPIALLAFYVAALAYPPTRGLALLSLSENYPVELITAIAAIAGGIFALAHVRVLGTGWGMTGLMGVGLVVLGMEELAWGQQLLHFEIPEWFAQHNEQSELTLHNLAWVNGRSEIPQVIVSLAGIAGILARNVPQLAKMRHLLVPKVLLSWFGVALILSAGDFYQDVFSLPRPLAAMFDALDELNEMIIAVALALYVRTSVKAQAAAALVGSAQSRPAAL